MAKSDAFETAFLNHIIANAAIANVGDASGLPASATEGSLYMSLHTGDPTAGTQATNECTYTDYARVALARDGADITVSGNAATLAADVTFPTGSGGSGTATHWGIGAEVSGATLLLWTGAISPSIVTGSGVTPKLTAGTVVTEA